MNDVCVKILFVPNRDSEGYINWNFSDQIPENKSIGRTIPSETSQLGTSLLLELKMWLKSERQQGKSIRPFKTTLIDL